MRASLCDLSKITVISPESLNDLDIFVAYPALEPILQTYITYDAEEVLKRSEIIGKLSTQDISLVSDLVKVREELSRCLKELKKQQRPLMEYSFLFYALEAYLRSVDIAAQLLPLAEPEEVSIFYANVKETVTKVCEAITPPKNVTLAVNISESGMPLQMGITNIESNAIDVVGVLGKNKTGINSLCDAASVSSRSAHGYLETYIHDQIEKQWGTALNSALRLMRKIDINHLLEWAEWLKPMELYYTGLVVMNSLREHGANLCRPAPLAFGSYAKKTKVKSMLYPHLVFCRKEVQAQDFGFNHGDIVMITGANSAGKTSVVKAYAQNCIFAQLGFWVTADSFEFTPFKQWNTVFAAGEDEKIKLSRFQLEAERMKLATATSNSETCLILNEPFTSTNPTEAAELLCDIIAEENKKGVTVILVTHIFDIHKMLLEQNYSVRSYVMGKDYVAEEKPPDGISQARQLADMYGFSIKNLIPDENEAKVLEDYMWRFSE